MSASPTTNEPDAGSARRNESTENALQLVSFRLAGEEYGLDIMCVQEIILIGQVTQMPQVPDYVQGLINLRGHVIPITDLRRKFQLEAAEPTEQSRIIVLNVAEQTVGIIVDQVNAVLRVSPEQIEPAPTGVASANHQYLNGLVKLDDRLLILLSAAEAVAENVGTEEEVGSC